jgi:glycosyltransferase involved in cell wall biosynthesis
MNADVNRPLKTLTIVVSSFGRPKLDELLRREAEDKHPRVSLFQTTLHSDMLDETMMANAPAFWRSVYKILPAPIAKAIEAYRLKKQYDAIISWGERFGLLFGLFLKFTGTKKPHIALVYWISKPKQAPWLRLAASHINRIITWSSVQYTYAVNVLGIPPSQVKLLPYCVDQKFFRPMNMETDRICAVGEEMRDYGTLIEAMRGLDIRCHIVAGTIRIIGNYRYESKPMSTFGILPENVTAGRTSYDELRALYARSKFVVLPLLPSETSSGLTVLLEAMAMGKAVICSRSDAQVDVIQEGKTGMFVPQGNATALREAIVYLWNHPAVAEEMGRNARKYIETHHTMEQFVNSVRDVVEEAVYGMRPVAPSTQFEALQSYTIDSTR